jgi:hypothetical protein
MNGAVPSCSGMYTTGTALSISIPLSFIFNNNSSVGGGDNSCSVCTLRYPICFYLNHSI